MMMAPPRDGRPVGAPSPPVVVSLGFDATFRDVRAALGVVVQLLTVQNVERAEIERAELVLAEILNNVAEHAYEDGQAGPVDLRVELAPGRLICRVRDKGRALPGGNLPGAVPADPRDLPEGGFGWSMVRALASNICYRRIGGWNALDCDLCYPLADARAEAALSPTCLQ
jgi:serine/threonine-protein kinase RsbW